METNLVWPWSNQQQVLCLKCPVCQNQTQFRGIMIHNHLLWQCENCANQEVLQLVPLDTTIHTWSISPQPCLN